MTKKHYTLELILPDNSVMVYEDIISLGLLKAILEGEIQKYYNLNANITTHVLYNLIARNKKVNIFLKQKVQISTTLI